jgi:hypothetical protein
VLYSIFPEKGDGYPFFNRKVFLSFLRLIFIDKSSGRFRCITFMPFITKMKKVTTHSFQG